MCLTVDSMWPVCAWCDVLENFAGWTLPTENRAGPVSPARNTAGSATEPVSAWPNDEPCICIMVALSSHTTQKCKQNHYNRYCTDSATTTCDSKGVQENVKRLLDLIIHNHTILLLLTI